MSHDALCELIPALPKVLLHDHLDGGLRPGTIIELAQDVGHQLPADAADTLAAWFRDQADAGSLVEYLKTFDQTLAVMQTAPALTRVAQEAVLDLASDGVVYAEQRWAPEQHLAAGLTMDQAVEAVQEGLRLGAQQAASKGHTIMVNQVLTAMRHTDRWMDVAQLAVKHQGANEAAGGQAGGVVGFDLAGAEIGFPPSRFPDVWPYLAANNVPTTIHAGEAAGVESMKQAVHMGQAVRLGHGVDLVEEITLAADGSVESARLSPFAHWVRDQQILLECCPTSNIMCRAGGASSYADHPISLLKELDFAVSINTDNRLMSRTCMSDEMRHLVTDAGWTIDDLADVTIAAAWSAFIHHDQRQALIENVIIPGFHRVEGAWL